MSFPSSDHCAVLFSYSIPDVILPGPGLWKLNISILQDAEYTKLITDFWLARRSSQNHFPFLSDWWELGKLKIKNLSIELSRFELEAARSEQVRSRIRWVEEGERSLA